jgi:methionyl-tRNA formyltransferase
MVNQISAPLGTSYFGSSSEEASVRGLEIVLAQPGINVVSVTCGRGAEIHEQDGPMQRIARAAGVPLLSLAGVRRDVSSADLVISFYNPVIFPADFIDQVHWGVLNIHPGPLPEYRGSCSVEHALLDGATEFGATLHFCDKGIDTGPIVDEERIPITRADTARALWSKVDNLALLLLRRTLPQVVQAARVGHRVPARPQDTTRAQYFDSNLSREGRLDLSKGWDAVVQQVRAYDHRRWEPAFIECDGHRIHFRYVDGQVVLDRVDAANQLAARVIDH